MNIYSIAIIKVQYDKTFKMLFEKCKNYHVIWSSLNDCFSIFQTHPWIFRDSNCPNERLVVKKNKVKRGYFECGDFLNELKYNREYNNIINGEVPICVLIQLPVVEDLRQLALKTVRGHVNRKEDCFCLNILPQQIQFEIADMFI